jgi:DNA polymerase III delta prime subunit
MQQIIEQHKKTGDVHHFHLLEGSREEIAEDLQNFLCNEFGVDPNDKSLYFHYDFDQFQVDDSRALTMQAQIKTPEGKKMIFLIFANSINHQAQNALLKILEEPSARTYFFMVIPKVDNLLPTFLSRAVVVRRNSADLNNQIISNAKEVKEMTIADRLKFVEKLVKDIKDEKVDRIEARAFVQNLISDLRTELEKNPSTELTKKIESLMQIEDYLGDSGASIKILLERAVLLL